jgi:RNA polymerase sigma-70 factor (ECF subfamily)
MICILSLFSVINVLVSNGEAEDVLQEFFVKIWKTLILIMRVKDASTWMHNIARNTSIDKLRSKNFNNSQKNLSSDNFVHLLERQWLVKVDTIGINEFVKNSNQNVYK